jgi:hypothetical protein
VGRALDDADIPGEEDAKIDAAANREWWRASNTTNGTDAERLAAAQAAESTARAAGLAAYRAARLAGGIPVDGTTWDILADTARSLGINAIPTPGAF